MRDAFYGDVTVEDFVGWTANLHCDEPAAVGIRPSAATAERFGGVTRHYIANNRGQGDRRADANGRQQRPQKRRSRQTDDRSSANGRSRPIAVIQKSMPWTRSFT